MPIKRKNQGQIAVTIDFLIAEIDVKVKFVFIAD